MEKLTIVKVGGKICENPTSLNALLRDFASIEGNKLLVHGGGRLATSMAERLGIETKMVDGRRITDDDMLEVVTMVYGGLVNKRIVAGLQALGVNALGMTGAALAFGLEWAMYDALVKEIATVDTLRLFSFVPFARLLTPMILTFCAAGLFVGIVGSLTSIRKFMDV